MPNRTQARTTNTVTEFWLCLFLGMFGVHRFYARKYGTAVLYLFSAGLFYIGWIVDIILICRRLVDEKKHPKTESTTISANLPVINRNVSTARNTVHETAQTLRQETIRTIYREDDSAPLSPELSPSQSKPKTATNLDAASIAAKTHKVTGMQHYINNIMALAVENVDYSMSKKEIIDNCMEDEKIWKYNFYPSKAELIPEPDNAYDKNAIKVIVDNQHVGYIKSGSCSHLLKVINEDRIRGIGCEIGGGPYKTVTAEYDIENDHDVYTLERGTSNYFVHLTVYESTQ